MRKLRHNNTAARQTVEYARNYIARHFAPFGMAVARYDLALVDGRVKKCRRADHRIAAMGVHFALLVDGVHGNAYSFDLSSLGITPGKECLLPLQILAKWLSDVNPGALPALRSQPSPQNHHNHNSYCELLFKVNNQFTARELTDW